MNIIDTIPNTLDNVIVIGSDGISKRLWQGCPDADYRRSIESRPDSQYYSAGAGIPDAIMVDEDYTLDLAELNDALRTEFATLQDFYDSLGNKLLVV